MPCPVLPATLGTLAGYAVELLFGPSTVSYRQVV